MRFSLDGCGPSVLPALAFTAAMFATGPDLSAQVTRQVILDTPITWFGTTYPAGTVLTSDLLLGHTGPYSFYSFKILVPPTGVTVEQDVSGSYNNTRPRIGPHTIRIVWSSPTTVHGTLRAESRRGRLYGGGSASVRGPGVELIGSFVPPNGRWPTGEWAVTIPAGGSFEVRVTASADPGGGYTYWDSNWTRVTFEPSATGRLGAEGQDCGASLHAGIVQWQTADILGRLDPPVNRLTLQAEGAPAGAVGFLVFGTQRRSLVLPPLGCEFRTDLLVPVPLQLDPQGRARLEFDPYPQGVSARCQFLAGVLDPVQGEIWRTSRLVTLNL